MVEAVIEGQESGRFQCQPVELVALGHVGAKRHDVAAHLLVRRAQAVGVRIAVAVAHRELGVAQSERRVVQTHGPGDAPHIGRLCRKLGERVPLGREFALDRLDGAVAVHARPHIDGAIFGKIDTPRRCVRAQKLAGMVARCQRDSVDAAFAHAARGGADPLVNQVPRVRVHALVHRRASRAALATRPSC